MNNAVRLLATLSAGFGLPLASGHVQTHGAQGANYGAGSVVGAAPAPPAGPGPGTLSVWNPGSGLVKTIGFAAPGTSSGSSFYVAADPVAHLVFVPTEAGITYVLSSRSWKVMGHFNSPVGSRVAKVTPNGKLLLVESSSQTIAYRTTAPYKQVFSAKVGGNALVIGPLGKRAFVGGNADSVITELALPTGSTVGSFAVPRSGDMVWAHGQLFSADIANGIMSAVNPTSRQIVNIQTPEVYPGFTYTDIPAAKAGFMQLAVGQGGRRVYAAGFSGHILAFSTRQDTYLGEVAVNANPVPGGPNQLSGLAVLPGGREAVTTVENLNRSVVVSLRSGKIIGPTVPAAANRWVSLHYQDKLHYQD